MYYKSILQILKDPSSNVTNIYVIYIFNLMINTNVLFVILMKQHYLAKKAELLLMNVMLIIKHM